MMRPESATAVALVLMGCLATPGCAAAETPQAMAVRGMGMIAEEDADEQRQHDGWQLLARAIGDMLLTEDLWGAEDEQLQASVTDFVSSRADEAEVPISIPEARRRYDDRSWEVPSDVWALCDSPVDVRQPEVLTARDDDGGLVAVHLRFTRETPDDPGQRQWLKVLIARNGDRMVTGAWQQYVGRTPNDPGIYGVCRETWHAWREDGQVRALFAGGWFTGGTGGSLFGAGGLLESAGDSWRTLDLCGSDDPAQTYRDYHSDEIPWRFVKAYLTLRDLNGDGVPEIVGAHQYGKQHSGPHTAEWTQRDYYVYKVIGDELRQVWYAKVESPRGIVLRFVEGLEYRSEPMVRNASTSADVVARARELGLFELDVNSGETWLLRDQELGDDSGSMLVFLPDAPWRFTVQRVGGPRWRVSGIEEVAGGYEAYYRDR